jgi:hypothetical protein
MELKKNWRHTARGIVVREAQTTQKNKKIIL